MEQVKPKFTFFQLSSIIIANINWSNLLIIHSERLLYLIFRNYPFTHFKCKDILLLRFTDLLLHRPLLFKVL